MKRHIATPRWPERTATESPDVAPAFAKGEEQRKPQLTLLKLDPNYHKTPGDTRWNGINAHGNKWRMTVSFARDLTKRQRPTFPKGTHIKVMLAERENIKREAEQAPAERTDARSFTNMMKSYLALEAVKDMPGFKRGERQHELAFWANHFGARPIDDLAKNGKFEIENIYRRMMKEPRPHRTDKFAPKTPNLEPLSIGRANKYLRTLSAMFTTMLGTSDHAVRKVQELVEEETEAGEGYSVAQSTIEQVMGTIRADKRPDHKGSAP